MTSVDPTILAAIDWNYRFRPLNLKDLTPAQYVAGLLARNPSPNIRAALGVWIQEQMKVTVTEVKGEIEEA